MELKKKFVSGFIWSAGEKFSSIVIRFAVSLLIMQRLGPEMLDPYNITLILTLVCTTIMEGGFREALIQKQTVTDADYNSVFVVNMGMSAVIYGLLMLCLGFIISFYEMPTLATMGPILLLSLPLNAAGVVHVARLERGMRFDLLSKIYFTRNVISSAVALAMLFSGWGVWSLVGQFLSLQLSQTLLLWLTNKWRPAFRFSMESFRSLFRFGSSIMFTGVIGQLFNQLPQLIIGKIYPAGQLSLYNSMLKTKDDLAISMQSSIVGVSFPAFSSMQNENERLKNASRKVIAVLSLIMFPVMAGIIATCDEAFAVLGLDKWMPAIPYFKVFCASVFLMPLTSICLHIIKAKGAGRTVLILEIIKKGFALAIIIVTANISVMALVWGNLIWMAFEMLVNVVASNRFIRYKFSEILRDTLPYLAITAVMYAAVVGVTAFLPVAQAWVVMTIKIVTGIIVYGGLNMLLRPVAWNEALLIAKGRLGKRQ